MIEPADGLHFPLEPRDGAGIRLQGLTIEQPSLDDVFLRVTGEAREHEVDEAGDGVSATPALSDAERAEVTS